MMHTIASHTVENRMTPSAVAVCMAPLLLRPLLAGECEMEDDFDINGDSSAQLIAAANAANSAHGIVTILLEEYENIFDVSILFECLVYMPDYINYYYGQHKMIKSLNCLYLSQKLFSS
jgi:hypothetical protein